MLKRKSLIVLISILLLFSVTVGCSNSSDTPNTTEDQTVKIGFLGAKTGGHAIFGLGTLKGMEMAVEEVNASGGVLGKQLELVVEDHQSKLEEIATITQKYVERDKVVAIIGDPTTGGTKTAAPIAQENQIVIMSAGSTGPGVVEIGDYVFRDTLLDSVAAPATMDYVVNEKGWKNVAVITSINNDYSVGLSGIFKQAITDNGGTVVIEENIQDGDTDFSAIITKIKGKNPDVLVYTGYYTEAALIMKEVRRQGMNDIVMVGGDGLQGEDFYKLGGDAVVGSISFAGFSPEQPTPTTEAFIQKFQAKYEGSNPDLFSAQGYDAVMLVVDAMKKANSIDPAVFHTTLAQTQNYEGVSGNISFQENREPLKSPVYLLTVKADGDNYSFGLLKKIPVTK